MIMNLAGGNVFSSASIEEDYREYGCTRGQKIISPYLDGKGNIICSHQMGRVCGLTPVLTVYFILCLDECIKVQVVFWYYRKYTWAQNLTG